MDCEECGTPVTGFKTHCDDCDPSARLAAMAARVPPAPPPPITCRICRDTCDINGTCWRCARMGLLITPTFPAAPAPTLQERIDRWVARDATRNAPIQQQPPSTSPNILMDALREIVSSVPNAQLPSDLSSIQAETTENARLAAEAAARPETPYIRRLRESGSLPPPVPIVDLAAQAQAERDRLRAEREAAKPVTPPTGDINPIPEDKGSIRFRNIEL